LLVAPGRSAADEYLPIDFDLKGEGWNRFGREDIIAKAMWLINRRFLATDILSNAYRVGGSYYVTGDLWGITNLNSYYTGKGYGDLLWYQLQSLRIAREKPTLTITAYYDKDVNAVAWAHYNRVKVKYSRDGFTVEGAFEITVNTFYLGGADPYSDPYYWAGTIAHEMLHNLGHMHDKSNREAVYYDRQMIVFERAVYWGGRYRRGLRTPVIRCGGRSPT
jgi:hypothetical protein